MVGKSVLGFENFVFTERTLILSKVLVNVPDVNPQIVRFFKFLPTIMTFVFKHGRVIYEKRIGFSSLIGLKLKFVIFALVVTKTARAFKCFLTERAIMKILFFTVMILNVDFQISFVLQNFKTIRTLRGLGPATTSCTVTLVAYKRTSH